MTRRLLMLIRMLVLVFTLTSLLALAVADIESSANSTFPVFSARWDSIHEENWPRPEQGKEHFYLIDRTSGQCEIISLPAEGRWSSLSVSPWSSDPTGHVEAVGLCFSSPSAVDSGGFLGLVRLRLPEARVLQRVQLDVLPTSRPCWVPDCPGSIVFAAGDGLLYRHDLDNTSNLEKASLEPPSSGTSTPSLRPLVWNCLPPTNPASYFNDPAWSAHPLLRHLLVATLVGRPIQAGSPPAKGSRLWWLKMNDDGLSIDASGPLFDDSTQQISGDTIQRFPTLAVSKTGEIRLAYLTHYPGQLRGKIEAVQIQVDPISGAPAVVSGSRQTIAEDCATLPPVFSEEGSAIFAIAATTGQLMKYHVRTGGQEQVRINVAGKG